MLSLFRCQASILFAILLIYGSPDYAIGSDAATGEQRFVDVSGRLVNSDGEGISNAVVTLTQGEQGLTRTTLSGKDGQFTLTNVPTGTADISYRAGVTTVVDRNVPIPPGGQELRKTLPAGEKPFSKIPFMFIPGVVGLLLVALVGNRGSPFRRHIFLAGVNGVLWCGVVISELKLSGVGPALDYKIYLWHPDLSFELYVPILGFVGALLFVLDLVRQGEDSAPASEFGMRIIMGPYVAIAMVVLFGHQLQVADLSSHVSRASVAFLSGLVVVAALQMFVEKGQSLLNQWRASNEERSYRPSQLAQTLGLSRRMDLSLKQAGLEDVAQISGNTRERLERQLRKKHVEDPLADDLIEKYMAWKFEKDVVGSPLLKKLRSREIDPIAGFAQLDSSELDKLAAELPALDAERVRQVQRKVYEHWEEATYRETPAAVRLGLGRKAGAALARAGIIDVEEIPDNCKVLERKLQDAQISDRDQKAILDAAQRWKSNQAVERKEEPETEEVLAR